MVTLLPAELDRARHGVVRALTRRYRPDVDLDGEVADVRAGVAALLRDECERLDYTPDTLSRVLGLSAEWLRDTLSGSPDLTLEWLVILARVIGYRLVIRLEPVEARRLYDVRRLADRMSPRAVQRLRREIHGRALQAVREAERAGRHRQPVYPSSDSGAGKATDTASDDAASSAVTSMVTTSSDASTSRSA